MLIHPIHPSIHPQRFANAVTVTVTRDPGKDSDDFKLNGERSVYQSLLSSQMLPEHECVEVTLHERVAAHISAVSSPPPRPPGGPEESKIIRAVTIRPVFLRPCTLCREQLLVRSNCVQTDRFDAINQQGE
jgi:hypothetical protein